MSGFDWRTAFEIFLLIAAAYALALPIGWDQEKERQPAGLRVFPIVAAGACAFILIASKLPGGDAQTQARVLVGVISAVGFIGGGAILKDSTGEAARGTAAAASIWVTGAIGVAVASKQYVIAIILSCAVFLSHKFLRPAGDVARNDKDPSAGEKKNESSDKNQKKSSQEKRGEHEQKGDSSDNSNKDHGDDSVKAPDFDIPSRGPEIPALDTPSFDQARTSSSASSAHFQAVSEVPIASPPEGSPASIWASWRPIKT